MDRWMDDGCIVVSSDMKSRVQGRIRRKGYYRANTGPMHSLYTPVRTTRRMVEGGPVWGHDDLEEGVM